MKTTMMNKKEKELVIKKEIANKETVIKDYVKVLKDKANSEKNKQLKATLFNMVDYFNTFLKITKGQIEKGWLSEEKALLKFNDIIKNHNIEKVENK